MCGGTEPQDADVVLFTGLSPRVRGNRHWGCCWNQRPRSIPACAGEPDRGSRGVGQGRVYPRVCGGTGCKTPGIEATRGLSPRVRGNRLRRRQQLHWLRSIPACAGEPWRLPASSHPPGVYPRVCGGTQANGQRNQYGEGLSPRVRGNPVTADTIPVIPGSIPACAGEPAPVRARRSFRWVYPRVCGGTRLSTGGRMSSLGLSPRVRGNLFVDSPAGGVEGSIPACAGEPRRPPESARSAGVYPRVCGGTDTLFDLRFGGKGLSPRVRGNRGESLLGGHRRGSIPACAGEPSSGLPAGSGRRVYPRVCGGTPRTRPRLRLGRGLSPRVRGNLYHHLALGIRQRSIPACAGEPHQTTSDRITSRVYPRVCGGTIAGGVATAGNRGLSPRVRGNRHHLPPAAHEARSIPACAGEPNSRNGLRRAA